MNTAEQITERRANDRSPVVLTKQQREVLLHEQLYLLDAIADEVAENPMDALGILERRKKRIIKIAEAAR